MCTLHCTADPSIGIVVLSAGTELGRAPAAEPFPSRELVISDILSYIVISPNTAY